MVLKLKFFGLGIKDNLQSLVELYSDGKLIFSGLTYNGEICFNNLDDGVYFMKASFLNETIVSLLYNKKSTYYFFFNHSYFSRKIITFTLMDYFYSLPIERGELILWQK